MEVDRSSGGRSGAIALSLALLLLAVVAGIILPTTRPPVSVLVGWSPWDECHCQLCYVTIFCPHDKGCGSLSL